MFAVVSVLELEDRTATVYIINLEHQNSYLGWLLKENCLLWSALDVHTLYCCDVVTGRQTCGSIDYLFLFYLRWFL